LVLFVVAFEFTSIVEGQALKDALIKQLEYYFSKENLMTDRYLLSQMNSEMYVPIKVIATFKMIKSLTADLDLIVSTLKEMKSVVLDESNTLVRPNLKPHKNVIILRELPSTTPVEVTIANVIS
jgi:la-related protein 4